MKNFILLGLLTCTMLIFAQENIDEKMEKLLQRIEQLEKDNQSLKKRLDSVETDKDIDVVSDDIEKEVDEILGSVDDIGEPENANQPMLSYDLGGGTSLQLLDISLNALVTVGTSTADEDELLFLQNGDHDPKRRGFTLQQFEFFATGAIDPYVRSYFNFVIFIDEEGETVLELEEAFFVTQTLPYGLQVKAGQFYTEFGRHNYTHPHEWWFVDQPVVLNRFFGSDGLRNPGARVSWVAPVPWRSEFLFSAQNAFGETAISFLFEEGEEVVDGHQLVERDVESFKDLLYLARWVNAFMPNENVTLETGYSFLVGPNATGDDTTTFIHGWDLYVKWKSRKNRGYPFVAWHTEALLRNYEADADPANVNVNEVLQDWGFFTQLAVGFDQNWTWAGRYEYSVGDKGDADRSEFRDERHRISTNVTYYPSEFFTIRLQYNFDKAQFLDSPEHTIWLQFGFLVGAHGAHKY